MMQLNSAWLVVLTGVGQVVSAKRMADGNAKPQHFYMTPLLKPKSTPLCEGVTDIFLTVEGMTAAARNGQIVSKAPQLEASPNGAQS